MASRRGSSLSASPSSRCVSTAGSARPRRRCASGCSASSSATTRTRSRKLSFDEFVECYNTFIAHSRRSFEDTYTFTEHLGKGAFASVKKATVLHPAEGMADDVAVKVVKKAGVDMQLLHNEISIWSMLTHNHLVRLYDAFETPDERMLVTELMRGGDLFERLRDIESFDEASAQELAAQIVSAMGGEGLARVGRGMYGWSVE